MLNFCSLYSGSTGNCLFVNSGDTNILVDVGVSLKKVEEALSSISVSTKNISGIVVTHEHSDHISGIGYLSKKYNVPIYANKETWNAISSCHKEKISEENIRCFEVEKKFQLGELEILPFNIPHDAANPCGFNVCNGSSKMSIVTDLGHVTSNIYKKLEKSSFIMLESNYEPSVLRCSSYPYVLKQRIDGPNGHLSNNSAGQVVSKLIPTGLSSVMLGHLSKENNFPELAYATVLQEMESNNFNKKSIAIDVASRICPSKLIKIS